ncbi:methyltransferase-like protein 25B [Anopheles ziemanni]|uniref:methyltransferase-like protein 25B n=1 Tax=Anopheles coustani TaxID=139045 RepID=UPI002658FD8A|nr:methyltransferase-like protein 25B [Anopheles coustani]XP_058178134.1 methyltransferase-like protein 25B [Anopheles ziemanni]
MANRFSAQQPFDYNDYFSRAVTFLYKYKWIFYSNNTKFIRNGVLDAMPPDWVNDLHGASIDEFNRIPLGFVKDSWSPSFLEFLTELKRLSVEYDQHDGVVPKARKGISIKKCYEIENLTSFIDTVRPAQESELLIDFGCGVGHLSQFINETSGRSVLGIEGNFRYMQTAQNRQNEKFPSSSQKVQYLNHFITDDSTDTIRREVEERFSNCQQVSITGLHACADLSVSAIRCFLCSPWVQHLIIMPCCYHKMSTKAQSVNEARFQNMPMSEELAGLLVDGKEDIICRAFLRLGCQQTAARWKDLTIEAHLRHGRIMFRRGLIDAVLRAGESVKVGKVQQIPDETTVENMLQQFTLESETEADARWTDEHRMQLNSLLRKYPDGHRLAEYLECLQSCLQAVCENIILLDRMCYMEQVSKRCGIKMVRNLVRLKNDGLSPRCFIFYASKA